MACSIIGFKPRVFFLRGVYSTPVENMEDSRKRLIAGYKTIRKVPGVFERVWHEVLILKRSCTLRNFTCNF